MACRGRGRRGGGAGLIAPSLLHSFTAGKQAMQGWELPWVTGPKCAHPALDPGPWAPSRTGRPLPAGRLGPRRCDPTDLGVGPGGGPSAGDPHVVSCGVGGRGKDEGLSSARPGGGWRWALSGCSSSCGGGHSPLPRALEALRLLLGQPVLASATVSPPQVLWTRAARSSVSEFAVTGATRSDPFRASLQ